MATQHARKRFHNSDDVTPTKGKGKAGGATSDVARIKSFVGFCTELVEKLPICVGEQSSSSLLEKMTRKLHTLNNFTPQDPRQPQKHSKELDDNASQLWNTCRRIRIEDKVRVDVVPSEMAARTTLLLTARVYSVLVLSLARVSKGVVTDAVYCKQILKLVPWLLKTARMCLDEGETDLAEKCLAKCAKHLSRLRELRPNLSKEEAAEFDGLDAEWIVYRLELAWKQGSPDIATHMYEKFGKLKDSVDASIRHTMAERLFAIGKHDLETQNIPKASQWLEYALAHIVESEDDLASKDAEELKLAVYDSLVKAKIALGTPDDIKQAQDLIEYLQSRLGDSPVVLYLRLALLESTAKEEFDADAFAGVLRKMAKSFIFTAEAFEWMCAKIFCLHERRPQVAVQILDELILTRVLRSEKEEWITKTLALRVKMTTAQDNAIGPESIQALFDKALGNLGKPLAAATVTALQSLLWPKIEAECASQRFDNADKWCLVALHELFQAFGPNNRAILQRRRMLCAIETNNPDAAAEAFEAMEDEAKNEPMAQYLLFKTAVAASDCDMATGCLKVMLEAKQSTDYILACVHAAQQAQAKLVTLEAMQALLKCYNQEADGSKVALPTLLRCSIRLLQSLIGDSVFHDDPESFTGRLCDLFEAAVAKAHAEYSQSNGRTFFTFSELRWFSDNAYNCAVTHAKLWGPDDVARLFAATLGFLQLFPDDIGQKDADAAAVQCLRCRFGAASCFVAMARAHDRIDRRVQDYQAVRQQVNGFYRVFERSEQRLDESRLEDLTKMLASLMIWDFEAAVTLRQWNDLGEIVRRAKMCKSAGAFKEMADCIVYHRDIAPQAVYPTLTAIINEIWQIDRFHLPTLAKYNRFVVLAVLPQSEADAFNVVHHVVKQVQDAAGSGLPYPPDEVQWLVAKAFNQAVKLCYIQKDDDEARRWAHVALALAQYCGDGGAMESSIYDKMESMKLNLG